MGLETLSDDVFRRGCGVTRSFALRGPRYRKLLTQVPHVPNATHEEVAEMMLLGEMLADKAFLGLPKHIRDEAAKWNRLGEYRQFVVINEIMKLTSQSWQTNHPARVNRSNEHEALPHMRGSWARGKTRPNCLGMAQMLIGFARATKAPHLMIDTLIQRDDDVEQSVYGTMEAIVELLSETGSDLPVVRQELVWAKLSRRRSLMEKAEMSLTRQAHHALLMKTRLGWMVIDPYLQVVYPYIMSARRERSVLNAASVHPNTQSITCAPGGTEDLRVKLHVALAKRAISVLPYIGNPVDESTFRGLFTDGVVSVVAINVLPDKEASEKVFAEATKAVRKYCLLPLNEGSNEVSFDLHLSREIRTARKRDQALRKLFRMYFSAISQSLVRNSEDRYGRHPLIGLAHPTYHLAVMTLNHVAHQTSAPSGELIRLDGGQWLVHDTLKEVVEGDNPRLKRIMQTKLARLGRIDQKFVLPALRPFTETKE